jgi:hypothetical protein
LRISRCDDFRADEIEALLQATFGKE